MRERAPASRVLADLRPRHAAEHGELPGRKMWRQPGVYLFRLDASFDTRRLKDDIYVLVATASDTRGNAGTGRFVFTIHNKRGFFSR